MYLALSFRTPFRHPILQLSFMKSNVTSSDYAIMGDPLYQACFDSLTFGVDTTIGYFDLSTNTNPEKAFGDEAANESTTSEKWIQGHELKGKLEQLVSEG